MKRSEFGKTAGLVKRYLEEEKAFGETDVLVKKTPPSKSVQKQPVAPATSGHYRPQSAEARAIHEPSGFGRRGLTLDEFRREISNCTKCPLGKTRINFVFGTGKADAGLMFIGEGPGYEEDRKGEPFVGKAGQLLTKIIEAMKMSREDVYIANIVKCHPMTDPGDPEKRGNDRPPSPEEVEACLPYLETQISLIKPKVICCLGSSAAKTMLRTDTPISKLRGKFFDYKGAKLMPTYHPAALLRNPELKKDVWEDMKMIMKEL